MIKPTQFTAKQLCAVFDQLYSDTATMRNHFQEINDLICPSLSDVTQLSETPGRKKGLDLYTGVGQYCINKLSNAIHASLTSSSAQWFDMGLSSDELMDDKEISDWFGECSRIQFDYMLRSNFHNEITKTYRGMTGHGTAALITEESIDPRLQRFDKLRYETWSSREWVFVEGGDELPTMIMRKHRLTPAKAFEKWATHPRFRGLGESVQKAYDDFKKRYAERHEFVEYFFKRTMYVEDNARKMNWRHMPWGYGVISLKDKHKIIEGGYMEQPVAVGRWLKNADDLGWGRSPAMDALPVIKTINEVRANGLGALGKDLNPPIVATYRGVVGQVRTHAGAIIYKKRNSELDRLDSGARYDAYQMAMMELAQEAKEHFMIDMIEMQPNDSKTLGEFQVRHEQMMRLLGPTYGRITYDVFNPVLTRSFNILLRNNKFPQMPGKLIELAMNPETQDMVHLDVSYNGPLARSQRLGEVNAIHMAYQDAAGIAELTGSRDPFDHLDMDKAMELSSELRGVPSEVIRSADDIEDIRQRRQEAEAQMMQQEQDQADADLENTQADTASKVVNIHGGVQ